jgi:hypothetical protein
MGARFSAPVQTGPGAYPASCTMGTASFPGVESGRGVTLTPTPTPLLSLRAFVACKKGETYLLCKNTTRINPLKTWHLPLSYTKLPYYVAKKATNVHYKSHLVNAVESNAGFYCRSLMKSVAVLCGQNAVSLNVSEDCTWTTPVSMAVYIEVRNLGNTKRINKGYNLPGTNYVKVFYTTHVLTRINFLLYTISVLAFISLCPAFERTLLKSRIYKMYFQRRNVRSRVNVGIDLKFQCGVICTKQL